MSSSRLAKSRGGAAYSVEELAMYLQLRDSSFPPTLVDGAETGADIQRANFFLDTFFFAFFWLKSCCYFPSLWFNNNEV